METQVTIAILGEKYKRLAAGLTERMRRHWAAAEALALPRGGISLVAKATGLSRTTITAGIRELTQPCPPADDPAPRHSRRPGGGRHHLERHDASLIRDLEQLLDPVTRGDPMSALRWTCKRRL